MSWLLIYLLLLYLGCTLIDQDNSQWTVPLQISHPVLGFLITPSLRPHSPLYLKTLLMVMCLFLNASVVEGATG